MRFRAAWRRGAVVGLALAWSAIPSPAHASGDGITAAVAGSSVCELSLTIQLNAPATAVPRSTANTAYSLVAAAACQGANGASALTVTTASGSTVGPASCAQLVSINGIATVMLGTASYPVGFYLAGLTAAPQWSFASPLGLGLGGVAGAGQLLIAPASLQSCLLGGTSSLQYPGVLILVGG